MTRVAPPMAVGWSRAALVRQDPDRGAVTLAEVLIYHGRREPHEAGLDFFQTHGFHCPEARDGIHVRCRPVGTDEVPGDPQTVLGDWS